MDATQLQALIAGAVSQTLSQQNEDFNAQLNALKSKMNFLQLETNRGVPKNYCRPWN